MTSIESTPSVQSECTWVSPFRSATVTSSGSVPLRATSMTSVSSRISGGIQGRSRRA